MVTVARLFPICSIIFEGRVFGGIYCIAGNFRGAIFSWISWFEACARKFYSRIPEQSPFMKQCADTATTKILPRNHSFAEKHENIAPRKLPAIRYIQPILDTHMCEMLYFLNNGQYCERYTIQQTCSHNIKSIIL